MRSQQWDNSGGNVQFQGTATNPTFHMHVEHQDRKSKDHCLDYFAVTDPRDVKTNIRQTRGGALKESYEWILRHPQFQCWRGSNDSQVLWVKGDPGKGKTMLLYGIIDELRPTTKLADLQAKTFLSFFFCQATVPKLSNAHAVLRGLIYMLVDTQPSLLSHVQKRFKETGEPRFGEAEAWTILCNMFLDILCDSSLDKIYVVVDALDECVQDQDKLLRLILNETKDLPHVKWIISSRNHVEQRTRLLDSQSILSLELQENAESVSVAIAAYISDRIAELQSLQNDDALQDFIQQALQKKAEGTFLWVALVIQELQHVDRWKVRQVVNDIPRGLYDLYRRMIDQMKRLASEDMECCKLILSATALAYRPLQLLELGVVSGLPDEIARNAQDIETMIKRSGSFLTVRDSTIYFVHQSAKDYLIEKAGLSIFPSGFPAAHRRMLTQSLQAMHKTLRRDIYGLRALGTLIDQAKQPTPDTLAAVGYSCIYWVDHLEESVKIEALLRVLDPYWMRLVCLFWGLLQGFSSLTKAGGLYQGSVGISTLDRNIEDHDAVGVFLRERYLYWLEALSLLRGMTEGILAIQKLEFLLQERSRATELQELVQDAFRFIRYHRDAIEHSPLQAYGSAMMFSPPRSMIKQLFKHEWPRNTTTAPAMGDNWSAHTGACLQTLVGHDDYISSVAFSHDSSRVVSGSGDKTIKIWDAHTGACLQTLEGHDSVVTSVVFSHDSSRVASGSHDKTIKIWDTQTGACLQTLEGHNGYITSVIFSHDSSHITSGSSDRTIKIWDTYTSACLQTLEGHDSWVISVVFSYNSSRIVSGSPDKTIKIWDTYTRACLQTLERHNNGVTSVVFSHDSSCVASGSLDKTIKIWDTCTGACLQTLEGHTNWVDLVVFSHDSSRIASGSHDKTIKIWDTYTGACLQTLKGHNDWVTSVVFTHVSSHIASGSHDKSIKIWDIYTGACLRTLEGHSNEVSSVVFSHDSSHVASGSLDKTIKIWDTYTGACRQTLDGHDDWVTSVVFSHDSSHVASGSDDKTIKIWDAHTGACLQTLSVGSAVINLSFDTTGSSLHTDIGIIALRDSPTPAPMTSTDVAASRAQPLATNKLSQNPEYQGYGISSDRFWITRGSQNWLWLPPTYRPICSAVGQSGLTVVLGCQSGRVLIFTFALEDPN